MRIFYVVYIKDGVFGDCIEAIRLLCNPFEKAAAHITVRGPYKRRINVEKMNEVLSGNQVIVDRAGNFFQYRQNTVFFNCQSEKLKEVWNKPNFPEFNPHITIYDGKSSDFARALYSIVSQYTYNIKFKADELKPYISLKGQNSFALPLVFNYERISMIAKEHIKPENITEMPLRNRLKVIDHLCKYLTRFSQPDKKNSRRDPSLFEDSIQEKRAI